MRRSKRGYFIVFFVILWPASGRSEEPRGKDVVSLGKQATALVQVDSPRREEGSSGSAFCIDQSGLFITNAHVVGRARLGASEHYPCRKVST